MRSAPPPDSPVLIAAAWLTHLYTATGAALAFLATVAVVDNNLRLAFFWLALCTIVDATDGLLARAFRVKARVPGVDGSHLDDIVDYLTFVFVPAFLLYHAGRLPEGWGLAVVFAVLTASAIAFVRSDAKTSDHFFTGFPSYWNIVALYMVLLDLAPWQNAVILMGLCALIFVRIGYVYPSRTTTLRALTVGLGIVWGGVLLYLIAQLPSADRRLSLVSLAFPAYYAVLSLALHVRRA